MSTVSKERLNETRLSALLMEAFDAEELRLRMPKATYHPLADFLHIRLLPAQTETAGGVQLPGGIHERVAWDGVVLACGPGVMDGAGRFLPLQAKHGDRVVCQAGHYQALDGQSGFVRDRHLVARLPGPDHDALVPCGGYVALLADPLPRISETEGGLLVAAPSLRGAEFRTRRRGEELYHEFVGMGRRWERMGLERHEWRERFQHEYNALSGSDRAALTAAYAVRGETEYDRYVVPSSARGPGSGRVQGFGALVPAAIRAVGTGGRCWWDHDATLIDAWDGRSSVVLCDWRELAVVEAA